MKNRVHAFKSLAGHPFLSGIYKKLSGQEVLFCVSWLKTMDKSSHDDVETAINRLFLDQPDKPKNAGIIRELLASANTISSSATKISGVPDHDGVHDDPMEQKVQKESRVNIRVTAELRHKIDALAIENRREFSDMVRLILEEHFESLKGQGRKNKK
jgi:hypothetical protein